MADDMQKKLGQVLIKVQQGHNTLAALWKVMVTHSSLESLQAVVTYGMNIEVLRVHNERLVWTGVPVDQAVAGVRPQGLVSHTRVAAMLTQKPKESSVDVSPVSAVRFAQVREEDPMPKRRVQYDTNRQLVKDFDLVKDIPRVSVPNSGKPIPHGLLRIVAKILIDLEKGTELFHLNHVVNKVIDQGYTHPNLLSKVESVLTKKLTQKDIRDNAFAPEFFRYKIRTLWFYFGVKSKTTALERKATEVSTKVVRETNTDKIIRWAESVPGAAFTVHTVYDNRVAL